MESESEEEEIELKKEETQEINDELLKMTEKNEINEGSSTNLLESKYNFKNQFLEAYQLDFHKLNNPLKYLSGRSFKISLNDEFLNLINSIKGE